LHRFRDINTYLPKKLRRHVTVTTLTWGQFVITRLILLRPTRAQNLTILFSANPEKFKGCKIVKLSLEGAWSGSDAPDTVAPNDTFISGLTYFLGSQGSKRKNPILGQIKGQKS